MRKQVGALEDGDMELFLRNAMESGNSSARWLQNSFSIRKPETQGVALALAVSEQFLKRGIRGACRVHGGGFAGTIQVFIPEEYRMEYTGMVEEIFGEGSVTRLDIRTLGSIHVLSLE